REAARRGRAHPRVSDDAAREGIRARRRGAARGHLQSRGLEPQALLRDQPSGLVRSCRVPVRRAVLRRSRGGVVAGPAARRGEGAGEGRRAGGATGWRRGGRRGRSRPCLRCCEVTALTSTTATQELVGAARRKFLLPLALAQFICSFAGSNMNVMINDISDDLDTDVQGVQIAITLFLLTMAILMIPGSKLTDRWGRKRCFIGGLTLYGIGALLSAISPSLGVLILGNSIFEGVGTALLIPPVYILATLAFADVTSRARAFGVIRGWGVHLPGIGRRGNHSGQPADDRSCAAGSDGSVRRGRSDSVCGWHVLRRAGHPAGRHQRRPVRVFPRA